MNSHLLEEHVFPILDGVRGELHEFPQSLSGIDRRSVRLESAEVERRSDDHLAITAEEAQLRVNVVQFITFLRERSYKFERFAPKCFEF